MKRILLDTNIYVSAILFGGKPREIINLAREGKFKVVISDYILWEIREVLRRKFQVPESRLNQIEYDILSLAELTRVSSFISRSLTRDSADDAILACAIEGKADAVVTGDNDLLILKKYKDILMLTPHGFLKKIQK